MKWLAQVDSNHRPRAYQARALTTWAMSHYRGRPRCRDSPSFLRSVHFLHELFVSFLAPDPCPVVEMMGFEPMTPCLQGRCSPSWATPPYCCLRQWYCFAVILLRSDIASQWYALGMGFCFFSKRSFKIEQRIDLYLDKTVCYVAYMLVMYGRFSIERRWSSRTFRYGYLVTT